MTFDPFNNLVLDKYEQEIEDNLPDKLPKPDKEFLVRKKELEAAAKLTLDRIKSKPITLRVRAYDLERVKQKAVRNAIPYQTLLSALIHRYAEGEVKLEL